VIVHEVLRRGQITVDPVATSPAGNALLAELKNKNREFDAVVIGEPHRAFYGNQYGLTIPLFDHYGVPLWCREVGGPIDPHKRGARLVMSVFGGMSKGERNRVKIRVRSAMAAQAEIEGRFLGRTPALRLLARGHLARTAEPAPKRRTASAPRARPDRIQRTVVRRIFGQYSRTVAIKRSLRV